MNMRTGWLLVSCLLAGCGRLHFDELREFGKLDGGAPYDADSTPYVELDASELDGTQQIAIDGAAELEDGSAGDAELFALDARSEDGSVEDAASCPPGLTGTTCATCVRYVDRSSGASLSDGLSWQRAYPDLAQALLVTAAEVERDQSVAECQIWVREGRYYVYQSTTANTIALSPELPLYGGFSGNERSLDERAIAAHPTILDGTDARGENHVYHVMVSTSGGLVDGFTLTGGRAAGSGPHASGAGLYVAGGTLRARNLVFVDNAAAASGGAIYALNTALSLEECRLENNTAGEDGGALAVEALGQSSEAWLTMRSIDLRANRAGGGGGGLSTRGAVWLRLENLVVADNLAGSGGGGASLTGIGTLAASTFHANRSGSGASGLSFSCGQSCTVLNSIFWDPSALPELVLSSGVSARHNIVNGGSAGLGNLDTDPLFVAPSNDLHLRADSPAIDSADGCAGPERDREGQPRRDSAEVANSGVAPVFSDRGAYEHQTNGAPYADFSEACRSTSSSGVRQPYDKTRSYGFK